MTARAHQKALTDPLLALSLPKAWPNQDYDPKAEGVPYLAITVLRASTTDRTLDAEAPIQTGRMIVTVVAETGKATGTADDLADTVAARYPMGLRLTAGSQTITITQPPHIREGIPDGGYWRVAVMIPYQSEVTQ